MKNTFQLSTLIENDLKSTSENSIIKTGFTKFDENYGGFKLGEFVVFGGRIAMGKTQFLINLALNVSKESPVLFLSFDLSKDLLAKRFISSLSKVSIDRILYSKTTEKENKQIADVNHRSDEHQIFINDQVFESIQELKKYCEQQVAENKIKLIFLDCLQNLSDEKYRQLGQEFDYDYVTRELRHVAKRLNICVVLTTQLSKNVDYRGGWRKPLISDIIDGGNIELDADKILLLYCPSYYGILYDENEDNCENTVEIHVVKNKNGKTGIVKMQYDDEFTNFIN